MADFNEDLIRNLDESIRELNSTIASAMGTSTASTRSFGKATNDAAASATVFSSKTKEASVQTSILAKAHQAAAEASYTLGNSLGKLNDAATQGVTSVLSFGRAILTGTDNFAKFGDAINQGSKALQTGFSAFGPLGRTFGLLLKPLSMVAESALALTDNLFEAKDELAKFGAVGVHTVEDIRQMGAASGYSADQLAKYTKMMTSSGIGLVALGGNVNQGATEFAKLTAITKEERMAFQKRGISMDQFVEQTAEFVQLQAMSGKQISERMKTDGTLQRMAKEYTSNLQILANITGETVEEQRRQQRAIANHRETVIADSITTLEINRLMKGNKADQEKAMELEKKREAEKDLIHKVTLYRGEEAGKAIAHLVKTGIVTEDTMKIMNMMGVTIPELLTKMAKGEKVGFEIAQKMTEGSAQFMLMNKNAILQSKEFGDIMGVSVESARKTAMFEGKNFELEFDNAKKAAKAQEESNNVFEQARNDLTESTKAIKISFDNMVSKVSEEVAPKIGSIATSLATMVTEFEKNNFKEVWGTVKWMFESAKDVFEKLKKIFEQLKTDFGDFSEYLGLAATGLIVLASGALSGKDKSGGGGGVMGTIMGGLAGAGIQWGSEKLAGILGEESLVGRYISAAGKTAAMGAVAGGASGEGIIRGAAAGAAVGTGYQLGKDMGWWGGSPAPKGSVDSLLDLIGKVESSNNYNILVDNKPSPKPLTSMTISEVLAMQSQMGKRNAAGKYQIERDTMLDIYRHADLKLDDLFNESNQDKLAMTLLKLRGRLDDYLGKKIGPDQFADNLSKIWAALPYNTGKSYYEGRGGNKALIPRDEFLRGLPQARLGGMFSGPNSGYPVMLHGMETVVPTPNPNTTLLKVEGDSAAEKITNALSGMNGDALQSIMEQMYQLMDDKLSDMVDKLSTSNDIQDKLLKVQM